MAGESASILTKEAEKQIDRILPFGPMEDDQKLER